tara:strand:+ start:1953 stop:2105 length:153 start_codon:yes stop_codon:yes gene_type:complete
MIKKSGDFESPASTNSATPASKTIEKVYLKKIKLYSLDYCYTSYVEILDK